jgi:hypothetical protein
MQKFLLYGASGYIGSHILSALGSAEIGRARLEDREQLLAEICSVQPTHLICAAGLKGKPNVVGFISSICYR